MVAWVLNGTWQVLAAERPPIAPEGPAPHFCVRPGSPPDVRPCDACGCTGMRANLVDLFVPWVQYSSLDTMPTLKATAAAAGPEHPVELCSLERLQFDLRNPRYGAGAAKLNTEREALDHIVETFGVNDVLSSIAVNGFFDSEPLVGIRLEKEKKIRVLEGNRRLAACLILAGDERASGQTRLREQYAEIHEENGRKPVSPVPVIVYQGKDSMKSVLPYIGVRHIVGFLEWDSYAKAAWVDQVLRDQKLTLREVMEMLGDRNGTAPRMLAGYRFVNQLMFRFAEITEVGGGLLHT